MNNIIINKPTIVYACAGAGKTTFIINTIINMCNNNIKSEEVFLVTYNKKAANELKERLLKNNANIKGMFIGTLHSFCYKFLKMLVKKGEYNDFNICNDDDLINIINTYKNNFINLIIKYGSLNRLIEIIRLIENGKIDIKEDKELEILYKIIKTILNKNKLLTFDMMIHDTIKILSNRNNNYLNILQKKFKYFFVDEFQDITTIQFKLIRLLSQHTNNICVVGDDDQIIYNWRGASPEYIINFKKYYKNAEVIKLTTNYRSNKDIVDLSKNIIENNENRIIKNIKGIKESTDVSIYLLLDIDTHSLLKKIIYNIQKNNSNNNKYKDCAILYRNNYDKFYIEYELVINNIPFNTVNSQISHSEIQLYLNFIKLLYDYNNIELLLEYFKYYNHLNKCFEEHLINLPYNNIDKKIDYYLHNINCNCVEIYKEYLNKIKIYSNNINNFLNKGYYDEFFDIVNTNIYPKKINKNYIKVFSENLILYIKNLLNDKSIQNKDNLMDLINNYTDKVNYLSNISIHNDYINLMTIHNSKGLEYNYIYLYSNENLLKFNEEDIRILYVAITRAKSKLYFTCINENKKYIIDYLNKNNIKYIII